MEMFKAFTDEQIYVALTSRFVAKAPSNEASDALFKSFEANNLKTTR